MAIKAFDQRLFIIDHGGKRHNNIRVIRQSIQGRIHTQHLVALFLQEFFKTLIAHLPVTVQEDNCLIFFLQNAPDRL